LRPVLGRPIADKTCEGRPSRQARHGPLVASRAGGRRRRTNAIAVPTPRRARMARWTSTPRRSPVPRSGIRRPKKGTRSRMRKAARPRPDADRGPAPIGRVAGLVERVLERALVSRETRGMFSEPSTANAPRDDHALASRRSPAPARATGI
jgi:hypothetical protein